MRSTHDEVPLELVVEAASTPAERVRELVLRRPDGTPLPSWSPGAHLDLVLPGELVRQYSLCGDPTETTRWRVAVLLEERSRGGSAYIHRELGVGAAVLARGPR